MTYKLVNENCIIHMRRLEDQSIDAIITDPPYGLKFMDKAWDDVGKGEQQREWHRQWLQEAFRVLKSGGILKAFGGTRTFHHLWLAMEDVGFSEIRVDAWTYGSGFPKSHNLSKQFEKKYGVGGKVIGYKSGGSVEDSKGHGGIARGCVGIVQKNTKIPIRELVSKDAKTWEGFGTALKPAFESVVIGYKPK